MPKWLLQPRPRQRNPPEMDSVMASARLALVPLGLMVVLAIALLCGCTSGDSSPSPATQPSQNASSAITSPAEAFPLVETAKSRGIDFTYRNGSEANLATILESLGGGVAWLDYDRDGWLDLAATGGGTLSADSISGRPGELFRNLGNGRFQPVGKQSGLVTAELYSHGITAGDYDNDGFQDFLITGYGLPQLWHNMGDGTFLETASASGIQDANWSSSAGWGDLNGDGNLDLYIAHYVNWSLQNHPECIGSGQGEREICPPRSFEALPHALYYSNGDGTFAAVSETAGLRQDGKGLGVLLADFEPDGDVDIYVANDTTDNFLYLNDGRGQFSEEGLSRGAALDENGIPNGSMGVDLCDFNHDGKPEIWVANYERESFALYRNEGNGNFLHVSQRFGITDLGGLYVGFGTACEDFDGDGDIDMAVANGHVIKFPLAAPRRQLPLLLLFDGKRFRRKAASPDCYFGARHEGRGLATADFDRDGDLDLAISELNAPLAFLENEFRPRNRWIALDLVGTSSNRDAVGTRAELTVGEKMLTRQVTGGGSYLSHSSRTVFFALPEQGEVRILKVYWPSGLIQTLDAASLTGQRTLIEPRSEEVSTSAISAEIIRE